MTEQKDDLTAQRAAQLRGEFINGMSRAAACVTIVTTDGPAGRIGVTVSAMTSVSADTAYPTLLVCVNSGSAAATVILENNSFCVNVLRDDQVYVSDAFAGRFTNKISDKFDVGVWLDEVDEGVKSPRLDGALACFGCTVLSTQLVGTHHIIIGEVRDVALGLEGAALVYANRRYTSPSVIETAHFDPVVDTAPSKRVTLGCFHSFGPLYLPSLIARVGEDGITCPINLVEGEDRRLREALLCGECDVALLYDHNLDSRFAVELLLELTPYVLVAENSPLAHLENLDAQHLQGQTLITASAQPSRDFFDQMVKELNLAPKSVLECSSLEMVRGLVGQGLGYAILMTKPIGEVSYDGNRLRAIAFAQPVKAARIAAVTRAGQTLAQCVNPTIEAAIRSVLSSSGEA